jgi:hypothetical protein
MNGITKEEGAVERTEIIKFPKDGFIFFVHG